MSAMEIATKFFHACEGLKGSSGCAEFLESQAGFSCQADALEGVETAKGYADWMQGVGLTALQGCSYDLHASSYDPDTRTALFFATFNATHDADGGPIAPTGQSTSSHYVYSLVMSESNKVAHVTKIWNAPWSMRELGWA